MGGVFPGLPGTNMASSEAAGAVDWAMEPRGRVQSKILGQALRSISQWQGASYLGALYLT